MREPLPRVRRFGLLGRGFHARPEERGGDRPVEVDVIEGLPHVVEGAELERFARQSGVLVGGDHDDREGVVELADPPEHLDAVDARHAHVEQDQVGAVASDRGQRVLAARGLVHGVALRGEVLAQHLAHRGLVIHNQDAAEREAHRLSFYPLAGCGTNVGLTTVRARASPAQSLLGEASEGAVEAPSELLSRRHARRRRRRA